MFLPVVVGALWQTEATLTFLGYVFSQLSSGSEKMKGEISESAAQGSKMAE